MNLENLPGKVLQASLQLALSADHLSSIEGQKPDYVKGVSEENGLRALDEALNLADFSELPDDLKKLQVKLKLDYSGMGINRPLDEDELRFAKQENLLK